MACSSTAAIPAGTSTELRAKVTDAKTSDDGDDTASTDDTAVVSDEAPEGVISWSDAAAVGTTRRRRWRRTAKS